MRQTVSQILYDTSFFLLLALWIIFFGSFLLIDKNLIELGQEFGEWSIRLLWIVALPGILKRFGAKGLFQTIQIILMRSRRRLGDIMFMLALNHFMMVQGFFYLRYGLPNLTSIPVFQYMGIIGLTLLLPLFLTSNNYSVRSLKQYWQKIHNLIYLAIWFIAAHTLLNGQILEGSITVAIAILQIASWIVYKRRQKKIKVNPTSI